MQQVVRQANSNLREEVILNVEDDEDDDDDGEIGVDERVVEDKQLMLSGNPVFDRTKKSSKMVAVLKKVEEIVNNGEKVVIVSDWVGYLALLGEHLDEISGASYKFYTGRTEQHARDRIIELFNTKKDIKILLLSLRAGGQGLNLMAANHVIIVDVHWNPQLEIQAQDRVYRIGQTRDVFVHKFICLDTIEERIVALQKRKLRTAENALSGTRDKVTGLGVDELCSLFNL